MRNSAKDVNRGPAGLLGILIAPAVGLLLDFRAKTAPASVKVAVALRAVSEEQVNC